MIAALIAGGIGFGIGPHYIPTRGLSFNTQPIHLQAFSNNRSIANLTLINPGTSTLRYRAYIAGIDRTQYVRVGRTSGPGIAINLTTSASGTCSFTVNGWSHDTVPASVPVNSQYVPSELHPVEIRRTTDGLLMFKGFVDTLSTTRLLGSPQAIQTAVTCVDIGSWLDRRIVFFSGGIFWINAPADSLISYIVNTFLQNTGISFVYSSNVNVPLGNQLFNYVTAREALNSIAQQTNTNLSVDVSGNLRFFDNVSGFSAAPQNITDTTANVMALTIGRTRMRFANRWYAKSNQTLGNAVQVDTYTVTQAGWTGFLLTQAGPPEGEVPNVTINGVDQTVIPLFPPDVQPNDTTWAFAYIGISVVYNWRLPALSIGDVVKVTYPGPLLFVAVAEDLTSIAADGLVEDTVEAGAITDKDTLQAIADEALLRGKEVPITLSIKTRTDGYQPGQSVNVVRSDPTINDNFLITSVNSAEINQDYFEHTVKCSNKPAQLATDPTKWAADLIKNLRMTTYNIIERITFNLAVTVDGLTNPGLTIGVKPAIKTAQKNGTAGWVTLIFNSLSQLGAVTTTDIVIDMLKNGASIYGGKVLTLPAGFAGQVKFSIFASDPFLVAVGDVFTVNVISADALAMDGVMELVTLG